MFKRASSNHSLWPTKARPNKTRQSVLAIGAFCIGAVAAISAHNVLTDLSAPSQDVALASSSAAVPIYAAPTPTPAMMESANIMNARMAAAKMLSESATAAVPSSATDGRGGAVVGAAAASRPSIKAAEPAVAVEAAKPAAEPLAKTAEVTPAAADPAAQPVDPAAKPATPERPKQAKRKRDPNYARRNQPVFPFFGFLNFGQRG